MNIATHCDECNRPLGPDKYIQSPDGGICQKKAWCPGCYEILHNTRTTHRVATYAARPSPHWNDGVRTDDDNEEDYQ